MTNLEPFLVTSAMVPPRLVRLAPAPLTILTETLLVSPCLGVLKLRASPLCRLSMALREGLKA